LDGKEKMSIKKYVLDRFEGSVAVLEDSAGVMRDFLKDRLPNSAREGDVLVLNEENGIFTIDSEATREKSEKIKDLMDGLFQ
jgi:hypothetical protein